MEWRGKRDDRKGIIIVIEYEIYDCSEKTFF